MNVLGFGDRRRRVAKLTSGAEARIEPGEKVEEVVQVQTGGPAAANAWRTVARKARPHVVVATDRHLYAMRLGGARLLDVGDVVLRMPLGQTAVRFERGQLVLGEEIFHVMWGFGARAERLVTQVEALRTTVVGGSEERPQL